MPNGKHGDNPLTDMFTHGMHPFPDDVEQLLRQLHEISPYAVSRLGKEPLYWASGERLHEGRQLLTRLIHREEYRKGHPRRLGPTLFWACFVLVVLGGVLLWLNPGLIFGW